MRKTKKFVKIVSCVLMAFLFSLCFFQVLPSGKTFVNANTKAHINSMSVDQIAALEKYDGRDYGLVPPVKDQGSSSLCWAYACSNLAEVSILRSNINPSATQDNLSFSPEALAKSVYLRGKDPLNNVNGWQSSGDWYNSPGNFLYGADVFAQWCAPVKEGQSGDYYENCAYRLTDSVEYSFLNSTAASIIPIAKKAIAEYGAIATSCNYGSIEYQYYNPKNQNNGIGHAIIIIGWDDTIDKDMFSPGPTTQNGGWIVKNSYNSNQYFYMSYDSMLSQFMALRFANNDEYQYNYFYDSVGSKTSNDIGGNTLYKTQKAANIFEAKMGEEKNEVLKAVNVHFTSKNTTCKVEVYTNLTDIQNPISGTLAGTGTAYFEYGGYRTINLDKPVKLDKNSHFSVVVEVSGSSSTKITCGKQVSNNSYVYTSYGSWNKINSGNTPRIKAYTALVDDEIIEEKIDIQNASLSLQYSSIPYSGKENKPNITLTYQDNILSENQDYTISFKDNINVGQATITITGINRFSGKRIEHFEITLIPNEIAPNSTDKSSKFPIWGIVTILCVSGGLCASICSFVVIRRKKLKHGKNN